MQQQKEDNRYYIPDIEHLRIGYSDYQVEYKEGIWTDMSPIADGVMLDNIIDLLKGRVGYNSTAHVRVPYLNKQQIEELGWVHTGGQLVSHGRQDYSIAIPEEDMGMEYKLSHHPKSNRIDITVVSYSDMGGNEYTLYLGECKDKNVLKLLMKLLKIQ